MNYRIKNITIESIYVLLTSMVVFALPIQNSYAGLAEDFREILIAEVSKEVEDKSLAADIVEIRFRREFDKWKGVSTNDQVSQVVLFTTKNPHTEDFSKLSNKNFGSNHAGYVSIGNRVAVGLSSYLNSYLRFRLDISGVAIENKSQVINGTQFKTSQTDYSLGSYIDFYPFERNFRVSAGLNLNSMKYTVNSQPNSAISINGKTVQAGNNYIDITYKFPKVTPFIGIGYETGTGNDFGWNGVAELGVMIGKYDAVAKTNLLGQNSISLDDLNAELNSNRNTLFKTKYQPIAKIGLKYGY